MIKIFIIFSLLTILSCAQATRQTGQFEPYVSSFEKDAQRMNQTVIVNSIIIQFGILPPQTLGVCDIEAYIPTITINPTTWILLTEDQKQLVIYHELGHCILKKAHNDTSFNIAGSRLKLTIMNSHPLELYDYLIFKDAYLAELFNMNSGNSL